MIIGELPRRARYTNLFVSCASAALSCVSVMAAAQEAQPEKVELTTTNDVDVADIVVTGSSIRGVPPTGSALIQVGAQDVVNTGSATTQELLATIPQLSTFNTAPRPDPRSNGILSTAPNIRGVGQAQTLVLINGHRLVGVGHLQNIPDPSIIPPSAIQRVEVIADGASSVYGSDGIAGVVNLITKDDYDGLEATVRKGIGKDYGTLNANAVAGTRWDGGGVMVSAEYAYNRRLRSTDRNYLTQDFSGVGGFDSRLIGNACTPATYRNNTTATGGPTGSFIQPATGAIQPRCDNFRYEDLYPEQERLSFFGSGHHQVADNVELYGDAFYSRATTNSFRQPLYALGGVMTRNNPFFPAFVPSNVPSISTWFNVSDISGMPERDTQALTVYGGTVGSKVDLGTFRWTTYLTGSRSTTDLHEGNWNSAQLNTLLQSSSPATAIDPFGGRTSDATKVLLEDWELRYKARQYIWEINTKLDGPLFTLPGGDVKIAVGGVHRQEFYDGFTTTGRIGFSESKLAQDGLRKVWSAFGELFVPIFGEENGRAGLRRLDISLSARHDSYSDFGSTTNPKIGVNWEPIRGVALRGSYGTSFHAPALPDLYGPDSRAGLNAVAQLPPGFLPSDTGNGLFIAGGNPGLDAESATTWSAGVDFTPINGLRAGFTYYNILFRNRIGFPNGAFFYRDPAFDRYFIANNVCNDGQAFSPYVSNPKNPRPGVTCLPQPIPATQVWELIKDLPRQGFSTTINGPSDLPPIYSVRLLRRANLAEVSTDGLDFDISYRFNPNESSAVTLQLNGNYVFTYDQRAAAGSVKVDQFLFGQPRFRMRGQAGGTFGPLTAVMMANYNHSYKAQYSLSTNLPAVEKIDSYTTIDLHLGYKLPEIGLLAGTEFTLDVDNAFDVDPPFARANTGYGNGNVLGRVVTLGIRKRF